MRAPRFIPTKGHFYATFQGWVYVCHKCDWRWAAPGSTRSYAFSKGKLHHRMQHR